MQAVQKRVVQELSYEGRIESQKVDVTKLGGKWAKCAQCGHYIIDHTPSSAGALCGECDCVRERKKRGMDVMCLDNVEDLV